MKKYFILGIVITAVAVLLSFSLRQEAPAGDKPTMFYGTAEAGATVTACLNGEAPCYSAVAGSNNTYVIRGTGSNGTYLITDGCWHDYVSYSGSPVLYDFCVPIPGDPCDCN